jgi:hypothetical protein
MKNPQLGKEGDAGDREMLDQTADRTLNLKEIGGTP